MEDMIITDDDGDELSLRVASDGFVLRVTAISNVRYGDERGRLYTHIAMCHDNITKLKTFCDEWLAQN